MQVQSVSAIVFFSPDPERLASFYRTHLGIPFEPQAHGPMRDHMECDLGDLHMAVLKGRPTGGPEAGGMAATFRVKGIDACVKDLAAAGVMSTRKIMDLGEGKRVATFRDPDGNAFNLIDLGF